VFEELDDEHQVEFLRERPDQEVAAVLGRMAADDAADLLLQIDQDRRLPILNLMPAAQQRKIKTLLGFNPSTAGGLMNPDFVSVGAEAKVEQAIQRVRGSALGAQQVSTVCVLEGDGKLIGAISLPDLLRADGGQKVAGLTDSSLPSVAADADVPEVARVMSDYNLIAIPVVDDDGRVVGLIAVDDVLELLIPEEWRWRAGAARG